MKDVGVTTAWDRPRGEVRAVLTLAHGAGGDLNDPLLRAVGTSLTEDGIAVLRFNFPYRDAGRRAPGAQTQSEECYRRVAEEARAEGPALYCGGKSYGGRIATHIAADGVAMAGLVLVSYPLHPPGKPDRLRDAHLAEVAAPMLFVQGTRDPFARPDLLAKVVGSLAKARLVAVEGADHSLRVRGRQQSDVQGDVTRAVAGFLGGG